MNGATALDWENTISRPNSTNTITIGTSQYFFSSRRNWKNSEKTRPLLIQTLLDTRVESILEHPLVVLRIAITDRIRRPSVPLAASPRQRILAGEPPDQRDRHQDDGEQHGQQHTSVDVAER